MVKYLYPVEKKKYIHPIVSLLMVLFLYFGPFWVWGMTGTSNMAHYKKDCYLQRNFFDNYKKPLEKLAFSTASLFRRQLLVKY